MLNIAGVAVVARIAIALEIQIAAYARTWRTIIREAIEGKLDLLSLGAIESSEG
jgi:hypothetical protein